VFLVTAQFRKLQSKTPPPEPVEIFAVTMQFLRLQPPAPPPELLVLLVAMTQLFNQTPDAPPPPLDAAVLCMMTQLATVALGDLFVIMPHTPPPLPLLAVAPPRSVSPLNIALDVNQAQRTAPGPFVEVGSHAP
jgi:hypothetical protein